MICENCGKEHNGTYGSGRFCSTECAHAYSSSKINKTATKIIKCIQCGKEYETNIYRNITKFKCNNCTRKGKNCKYFDINCDDCFFKKNNICKSKNSITQKFNTLNKYLDFIVSDYDTTVKEYLYLKEKLQNLINDGYSGIDIYKILFGGKKKGNTVLDTLQIKCKSLSEAVSNAYIQGKLKTEFFEKHYKHLSWNNKEFVFRSSYELDYAKELDELQINYDYESFIVHYFDSVKDTWRYAIPDFYLPDTNTIIEIKSSFTYNEQNMKDKVKYYKLNGYDFKLILNHKEIEI